MFNTKKGAMFGFDARLTLLIFAIVTVISVSTMYGLYYSLNAEKTLAESKTIAYAVESYQKDMNASIFTTLTNGLSADDEEQFSFKALVDNTNIKAPYNTRWNGPYLNFKHYNFKDPYLDSSFRLVSLSNTLSTTCNNSKINRCYVFLKFKTILKNECDNFEKVADSKGYGSVLRVDNTNDCDLYIKLTTEF